MNKLPRWSTTQVLLMPPVRTLAGGSPWERQGRRTDEENSEAAVSCRRRMSFHLGQPLKMARRHIKADGSWIDGATSVHSAVQVLLNEGLASKKSRRSFKQRHHWFLAAYNLVKVRLTTSFQSSHLSQNVGSHECKRERPWCQHRSI
jgi:hypothetical protein